MGLYYKPMKIENKKVKQNDLTNQKYSSNFCFIKSLNRLRKSKDFIS